MTVKFSDWIDGLVATTSTVAPADKFALVTDFPQTKAITSANLTNSLITSVLTTDGDILTRIGGNAARVNRAGLAGDPAFVNRYVERTILTSDGDLFTRSGGVITRISRDDLATNLANNTAFTTKYLQTAATELSDLTDIDTSGAVQGSILVYDNAASTWLPSAIIDQFPIPLILALGG